MCLIVFAYKYHPEYPLILAGNRDEFYQRPTQKLHTWDGESKILAGRDLVAGGTWLGVNQYGTFAALTNHRDLSKIKEVAPSRGNIVTDILKSDLSTQEQLSVMAPKFSNYNGFNLITGTVDELFYISNHDNSFHKLKPGLYGISNASLNTPWPKTNTALEDFSASLNRNEPPKSSFFKLLRNSNRYPEEMLPKTGLSSKMEKAVSSIFILTEDYGTRSSALLMIDKYGEIYFTEKTYLPKTKKVANTEEFRFIIKQGAI